MCDTFTELTKDDVAFVDDACFVFDMRGFDAKKAKKTSKKKKTRASESGKHSEKKAKKAKKDGDERGFSATQKQKRARVG